MQTMIIYKMENKTIRMMQKMNSKMPSLTQLDGTLLNSTNGLKKSKRTSASTMTTQQLKSGNAVQSSQLLYTKMMTSDATTERFRIMATATIALATELNKFRFSRNHANELELSEQRHSTIHEAVLQMAAGHQ
eukprot:3876933-Amphidinium_carterae.3